VRVAERVLHARWQPRWIRYEHLERYRFASRFVRDRIVVDCGCGDGTGTRLLAGAGAARVYGFDLSPEAIAIACEGGVEERVQFTLADALALPLPDASVDTYISLETIEHLESVERFLEEVVRVLASDGVFVCSTPNRYVYSPGHTLESRPWNRFHVRELAVAELRDLLSRHFGEIELYGQNPRHRLRPWLLNRAGRTLPLDLAVRLRQLAKLPLLVLDQPGRHEVRPLDPRRPCEILVAVCRRPLTRE
jgi:SAM-dependent methyltransferase